MQEKSVLLTPNKRLSRHLQRQFCEAASLQNKKTWHTPKILPLTTWLTTFWQECPDSRILLTKIQEKLLWQKIIAENLGSGFDSLADPAINFHEIVNGWQVENLESIGNENEDIATFQSIYKKFCTYCKHKNFVTISELTTLVIPYLSNYGLEKITFIGFDEYNPQLQSLITAFESVGCKILKIDPNNYQDSIQKRLGLDTITQEIIISAEWAKQILNKNPKASLGIVVPNLVELRHKIIQTFTQVLGDTKNINISAGIPLKNLPVINCALELLSLSEPFDLKSISALLLSPYTIDSTQEKSERFLFNFQLQQSGQVQFNLNDLKNIAKKNHINIPTLIENLRKWQDFFYPTENKTITTAEWPKVFTKILKTLGWPGENNLTDIESKAINHFIKLLQEVTTASLIADKISYKKALQILQELVLDNTLQLESDPDASIHIIGTLEAAGINFDYLWITGLDEESWPSSPKPTPFMPIALQKKLLLPHSSAERELHFCETLIKRYKRSAKEIVFSYVRQIEDRTISPSSLIADIPEIPLADLNLTITPGWSKKIHHSQKIEPLTNDQAPKLTTSEITRTPSRLLELQSLCPFRAFMEFRLKTKEAKKSSLGISKIDRGTIIHAIVEEFWQKVKSQKSLCALNSVELQELINSYVEKHLSKLALSKPLHKIEKMCLSSLLTKLFEIEKERRPFTVVATEKSVEIKLSSIPIKLRIDRIDRIDCLGEERILVLDYKTGKNLPSTLGWFGPYPENIQLLLYSLAIDAVEGLALIQINADSTKFKEISLEELAFGLRASDPKNDFKDGVTWHELIEYWRSILTKIADDFAAGVASVTPKSPQTCRHCSFDSACRVIR